MNAMRVKAMIVLGVMLTVAGEAGAATTFSYWKPDGSGNWSDPNRWQDGLLPTDTGNVKFSGTDGFATDADFDIITGLTRIRFGGTASLDLRFDEDHDNFFSNTVMNDGDGKFSTLIKSGTGTTVFTSTKNGFTPNRFIVTNGTLQVVDEGSVGGNAFKVLYGVNKPGRIKFKNYAYVKGLVGDGTVLNPQNPELGRIHFVGTDVDKTVYTFHGAFETGCEPDFNNYGTFYFMGTNSANNSLRIYDATVGVECLGKKGESGFGSLGRAGFWLQGHSVLRYLGLGETSDKSVNLGNGCKEATLDAGANGGLDLTGEINYAQTVLPRVPLTLTGSNAAPVVVSCELNGGNTTNILDITKRGTGTWRFADYKRIYMQGCWAVEEGTLEFASLYERGYPCSLGLSTGTDRGEAGNWAFSLGTHSTTGTLVCVGANPVPFQVRDRPFVVKGTGVVRNEAQVPLWLTGATSADAQGGTLVLDGAGAGDSFSAVTNGAGPLVVRKTGTGTWSLGGKVDVAGVEAEAGTLRISNCTTPYSWYRFTITKLWGSEQMQLSQFGLYDANGAQQNLNLTEGHVACTEPDTLEPGTVEWNQDVSVGGTDKDRYLCKLFTGNDGLCNCWRPDRSTPSTNQPNSWLSFTMRLAGNSSPVAYYAIKSQQGWQSVKMYERELRGWILEGSVDGRTWDVLDKRYYEESNPPISKAGCVWYHSDSKTFDTANPGWPIASAPAVRGAQVGYVKVTGGARIVAAEPLAVAAIQVDGTTGGTLENIVLAKEGTLDVTGVGDGDLDLGVAFVRTADVSNATKWTLRVNGETDARTVSIRNNHLWIGKRRGTSILFR